MNQGKRPSSFFANGNAKIYRDLKEIVRENVLPFLPAKSLRRCTAVCQYWKYLISTPFFAHNQSNSFRAISGVFCQSPSSLPSFISFDPAAYGVPDPSLTFLPEPVIIRCTSNGLLCCQGRTGYNAYYICNPVTKQWKKLPSPSAAHGSESAPVLVFEPSLLNFAADFKLVCAFKSELDGYEFEIYSSAEESWRVSNEIFFGVREIDPAEGVFFSGVAYWCSKNHKAGVLAFDLKRERASLVRYSSAALGDVDGKLCAAWFSHATLNISEFPTVGEKARVLPPIRRPRIDFAALVGYSNDRGIVMFVGGDVVVLRFGKKLIYHDTKTGRTRVVGEVGHDTLVLPYVNSLVELSS